MDIVKYVGERIRNLRLAYGNEGLSQEALASKLNVATNTISRWETGTYHPKLEELETISRFFGVSILTFFPSSEEEHSNDRISALLRTAKDLQPEDLEELRKYAEFRRARNIYSCGKKPVVGRSRKE